MQQRSPGRGLEPVTAAPRTEASAYAAPTLTITQRNFRLIAEYLKLSVGFVKLEKIYIYHRQVKDHVL